MSQDYQRIAGAIRYLDCWISDIHGEPMLVENAICIHEEDYGILWKHWDFRTERTEVPSRVAETQVIEVGLELREHGGPQGVAVAHDPSRRVDLVNEDRWPELSSPLVELSGSDRLPRKGRRHP